MPTDCTDTYRFGYSREELERLGDQHRVWAEENQRFLARAGVSALAPCPQFRIRTH